MDLTVETECPQCGAPIELLETDHLLRCEYCGVRIFICSPQQTRYILPFKTPVDKLIYAPYLRFRGSVFFCQGEAVSHQLVDITQQASRLKGLPQTLGLRPQAMKLKHLPPTLKGALLHCALDLSAAFLQAESHCPGETSGEIFHRAFIGETVSRIYLPLSIRDGVVFDAITQAPLARLPADGDVLGPALDTQPPWKPSFIATLCPGCGSSLTGERDSVVLFCKNCHTAWEVVQGKFVQVACAAVRSQQEPPISLPFWRMNARTTGLEIRSFADFIRATNQPRVPQAAWGDLAMSYWCPAFKIRPNVFLSLSTLLTLSQHQFNTQNAVPPQNGFPVTLPSSEAIESLKVILASTATNKKKLMPLLKKIEFSVQETSLVYIPCSISSHEFVLEQTRISINKKALDFGRQL